MRTARRLIIALLVLAVAGTAALIGTSRPDLDETQAEAENRWTTVVVPLDDRYETLGALATAVIEAGGTGSDLATETRDAVDTWTVARARRSVEDQVRLANELEGLRRRLTATVEASDVLAANESVGEALRDLDSQTIPEAGRAYNAAVADYEEERRGILRGLAADVLGFDAMPALDMGASGTDDTDAESSEVAGTSTTQGSQDQT